MATKTPRAGRRFCKPLSLTKYDAVHDPPRQQREQPGDHKRPGKNENHDAAMIGDPVTMCHPHTEWKRHQREDRQQVDRAPRADQPDLMDPERTDRHRDHQAHPDPADGAVRQRSLRSCELDHAKHEGWRNRGCDDSDSCPISGGRRGRFRIRSYRRLA